MESHKVDKRTNLDRCVGACLEQDASNFTTDNQPARLVTKTNHSISMATTGDGSRGGSGSRVAARRRPSFPDVTCCSEKRRTQKDMTEHTNKSIIGLYLYMFSCPLGPKRQCLPNISQGV